VELVQQAAAICFVFGLLLVTVKGLGRRKDGSLGIGLFRGNLLRGNLNRLVGRGGRRSTEPELRASQRIRLTPQHSIHTVAVGSKTWLVGCYSGGMSVLGEIGGSTFASASNEQEAA
jgi:hypothetical protein